MDMLAPDDGQFRMGGMLHASYSSSSGSAPPPHPKRFEELRAAVERFYPGDFLTLLMQPRPIYIVDPGVKRRWDLTENMLVILIVICIALTSLAYVVCERVLYRAGVLDAPPVFSKAELVHTYHGALTHYGMLRKHAAHAQAVLAPVCRRLIAYAYSLLIRLFASVQALPQRRSLSPPHRV